MSVAFSPVSSTRRPARWGILVALAAIALGAAGGFAAARATPEAPPPPATITAPAATATPAARATPVPLEFEARVRALLDGTHFAAALAVADSARRALEAAPGVDSLALAGAYTLLVESRQLAGRLRDPDSREIAEAAIRIDESRLGAEHPQLAEALATYARFLTAAGEYAAAQPLAERALAIREAVLGPDDAETAASLDQVASRLVSGGRAAEGVALMERALAIRRKALGPDHPDVAKTLTNLGNAMRGLRDYAAAESLLLLGLELRERVLPPDHLDLSYSLHGLGQLYFAMSDYARARPAFERAIAIREEILGPDHYVLAATLNGLATVLYNSGDLAAAQPIQERAFAIREKSLGPDHYDTGTSLTYLANTLHDLGDLEAALPLYRRAARIWEAARGPDNPNLGMLLGTIANVMAGLGEPDSALALYERALAINVNALGPDHPNVGAVLYNMASLRRINGDFEAAKGLYERSLAVSEKSQGPAHPNCASTLQSLAYTNVVLGNLEEGFEQALRSERIGRDHFRLTARALSEKEALLYAAVRPTALAIALSAAATARKPEMTAAAWDAVIASRALVLNEIASRRVAHGTPTPEVAALREDLAASSARLAGLVVQGVRGADGAARLDAARAEKEAIERRLAQASEADRRDLASAAIALRDVAAVLPPRSALIAYTRYRQIVRDRASRSANLDDDSEPRYLAFVMTAGATAPALVPLGDDAAIDALVAAWSDEARRGPLVAGRAPRDAVAAYRAAGGALRAAVWDPLAPLIGAAERVFIVPDGSLHLVNFAALPAGDDRYLLDEGRLLHMLTTERDLLPYEAIAAAAPRGLLAVGGVDFDSSAAAGADEPEAAGIAVASASAGDAPFRGALSACREFQEAVFEALPASEREVEHVVSIWSAARGAPAVALRGAAATEEEIKRRAREFRVLHLATHGFFIGEACDGGAADSDGERDEARILGEAERPRGASASASEARTERAAGGDPDRGIGGMAPSASAGAGGANAPASGAPAVAPAAASADSSKRLVSRASIATAAQSLGNPLRLSGLALAGANRRESAGVARDDGILTAEEIATLDLDGVEWAVLSACDTGVGEVISGEGVFGLRRAFQVAGAHTVLTSLWPIRDEVALEWMDALYGARFVDGRGTAESVARASATLLAARRAAGESTHPAYWAGFVAVGDWR